MNEEDANFYRNLLAANTDPFYSAKYQHGEVKAGWSYAAWMQERTAAWVKRSTIGCHTAQHH